MTNPPPLSPSHTRLTCRRPSPGSGRSLYALLTPEEVAERRGMSTGHLANLRSAGQGPTFLKLGRRIRYRLADLLNHENADTIEPIATPAALRMVKAG